MTNEVSGRNGQDAKRRCVEEEGNNIPVNTDRVPATFRHIQVYRNLCNKIIKNNNGYTHLVYAVVELPPS